jgi:hypothetical protein
MTSGEVMMYPSLGVTPDPDLPAHVGAPLGAPQ